ncbi:MAG: hypothetical protein COB16_17205 [Rhodobacteraceae bacterium]|nr:MAG: hypothetical protein COB16_17205 [Paracoccaceae bacterium]
MSIHHFMAAYKRVWEAKDSAGFAALFTPHGRYHNTPFQVQTGAKERSTYWDRIQLQDDISLSYNVLGDSTDGGVAHWNVTYQATSEDLFQIWAASTGTPLPNRNPGEPLPRMELDGTLQAEFDNRGLATTVRIWWHAMPRPIQDQSSTA